MRDESLLEDMRAAVRGDFERARERRERETGEHFEAPVIEIRGPRVAATSPVIENPVAPAPSEPSEAALPAGARKGRFLRLIGR